MSSYEEIRANASQLKKTKNRLLSQLQSLEDALRAELGELEEDVFFRSDLVILEEFTCYNLGHFKAEGFLGFHRGKLQIFYGTTEDLEGDMSPATSFEDFSRRYPEWFDRLFHDQSSIDSLIKNINSYLVSSARKNDELFDHLETIINDQSRILFDNTSAALNQQQSEEIYKDWLKARNDVSLDPSNSLTRTSSYLESVCRSILCDLGWPLPDKGGIANLIKAVEAADASLSLLSDPALKGLRKSLFGNVGGIFRTIGEFRTRFGTAHAQDPGTIRIEDSYARLLNDLAGGLSVFLLQQHKARMEKLPEARGERSR